MAVLYVLGYQKSTGWLLFWGVSMILLYGALIFSLCIGWMLLPLVCVEDLGKSFRGSRFFRIARIASPALLGISLILIMVLLFTIPHFHWVLVICSPPLLIISALALWQMFRKPIGKTPKKLSPIALFAVFTISMMALLLIESIFSANSFN